MSFEPHNLKPRRRGKKEKKRKMAEDTLYLQLHKLSSVKSEQFLDQILTTLWKTRRCGLCPPDKSRFHSLLSLPSLPDLDPKYQSQWKEELAKEQEVLPRLKSMTWTVENLNSAPANKAAIIHLKLQDYTKSPSGEREVKFQLTKDTLEAMLRSLTYISEQLSNMTGTSSEPAQKKQKQ
ncbi:hypothetical protein ES332_A11G259800v1 [Gossypium tomentosum]|uniref:COMM domain-containing protein n=1 Tax=Gossypium tomentosum TaxID=34277 RepID=A0A5D2NE55_GOSTO|nr:hypothetical protein ES332_A11G259800v1 [Gossypium tomentosum]